MNAKAQGNGLQSILLQEMNRIEFYIYEWFDLDNGDVFYVGKGHGDRYKKNKSRNDMFDSYIKTHRCDVRIVEHFDSEDDAFRAENEFIERYKNIGQCQTNIALGGRGTQYMTGEKNPMFGKPWFNEDTPEEKIAEWKRKVACLGERNAMFGVPPKERMDAETYSGWIEKHKQIVGDKNPNFGNRKLSKKYGENPELAKEKQSRPGVKNGRCVPVEMYDLSGDFVKAFNYIQECARYLVENNLTKSNQSNTAIRISECLKNNKKYCNHYFKFADQK